MLLEQIILLEGYLKFYDCVFKQIYIIHILYV